MALTLLDEIRACPQALLDARDTDGIAKHLSKGRTAPRRVPIADIQAQIQGSGAWWDIETLSKAVDHPAAPAAIAVISVQKARYENVDLTLPLVRNMFAALVAAGAMPQADMDAIAAMANPPAPVTEFEVRCACYANNGDWIP